MNVKNSNIKDLTGIQYFTGLIRLYCNDNSLVRLDVSKSTALAELDCSSNQLVRLEVSSNTALTRLYCRKNNLAVLDVSNNTALAQLQCSKNQLTNFDMRGVRGVEYLSMHATSKETNVIGTLKVHENLKNHEQIKAVKTARGGRAKIETYSATGTSTTYTSVCEDYDPGEADELNRCKDAP